MRSSALRILTYGAIEIYAVQIYATSFGAYRSITTLWGFSAFIVCWALSLQFFTTGKILWSIDAV